MTFPDVTDKRIHFVKRSDVKSIVNRGSKDGELPIPDRESMQREALQIYLDDFKTKICNLKLSEYCDIEFITDRIILIYGSLSNSLIGTAELGYTSSTWPCKELITVR